VRQTDLCKELGIDVDRMKEIRGAHLCSSDWFTHGKGGAVWISEEGQRKLRIWADVAGDSPHISHHFIDGVVLSAMPHPEWLSIRVKNGNDEWIRVPCRVPRRLKRLYSTGKKIRVEVVQSSSETGYRHESFADYPLV
jgi:hypothetical protein